jgi:uncharacterized membrane protein YheB (UPF0754 family)
VGLTLLHYLLPPIVGSAIGFTSDQIAIRMLFRPYKPLYLFGRQLPLTPGLFPKGQVRFAGKVAQMMTDKLLTPEEIQRIAQRLLTPERLEEGLRFTLLYILSEYSDPRRRARLSVSLGDILKQVFSASLPQWIEQLSRSTTLEKWLEQLFDQVILGLAINPTQAGSIAQWIEQNLFTPERVRQALVNVLTPQTLEALDREARERSKGGFWVVANLIGLKDPLVRLRTFCLERPEAADELFSRFLVEVGVHERLVAALTGLSIRNFSAGTIQSLRRQFVGSIIQSLEVQGPVLSQRIGDSIDWNRWAAAVLDRITGSEQTLEWIDSLAKGTSGILNVYLARELEPLVVKFLPSLGLEELVVKKICATSAQELEEAIQQVARNELKAIPYVGMTLGFCVGLFEVLLVTLLPGS